MNAPPRGGPARDALILVVLAGALFLVGLGARDLWNPNEPLYGQAVREMVEHDRWLRASVNGLPFDEKPILYFWLAKLSALALGGVDEFALRLPAAISGVVSVLLTWLLVLPYAGRRTAAIAGLLLATTFVVFWSAHRIQMDLPLTACTLAALVPLSRWLDHGARGTRAWLLAGVAVGCGVLTKGPVGLICPILPFVLVYALRSRGERPTLPVRLPLVAIVGAAAVAAPWYLALAAEGGREALGELLWRQNVERFVAPWDHEAPWWYYAKYVWIDFAPWAWFLPLAVALPGDGDEAEARLRRLAWIWLLATIGFFSISASKRSPYILPAAPAVAILVATVARRWLSDRLDRRRAWALRGIALAWGLVFAGAAAAALRFAPVVLARHPDLLPSAREAGALFAAASVAVIATWLAPRGRRVVQALVLLAAVGLIEGVAAGRMLPAANPVKSHRALCAEIDRHIPPGQPLLGYRLWRWRAGYSFYSERRIEHVDDPAALRDVWFSPAAAWIIVERARLVEARTIIGDVEPLVRRTVGGNEAWLFVNPAGRSGHAGLVRWTVGGDG